MVNILQIKGGKDIVDDLNGLKGTQTRSVMTPISPITTGQTTITLPQTPLNSTPVVLNINGVNYFQDVDFTVNGAVISWTNEIVLQDYWDVYALYVISGSVAGGDVNDIADRLKRLETKVDTWMRSVEERLNTLEANTNS